MIEQLQERLDLVVLLESKAEVVAVSVKLVADKLDEFFRQSESIEVRRDGHIVDDELELARLPKEKRLAL